MGTKPQFSRSGKTSPLGKCDDRLDIPMSKMLKEALRTLGTMSGQSGIPASEYARRILEEHAFGKLPMLRGMVADRAEYDDGIKTG
jgi:hypothetical protein